MVLQFKNNNKNPAKCHQDGQGAGAQDLYGESEEHGLLQPGEEAALDRPNSCLPKHVFFPRKQKQASWENETEQPQLETREDPTGYVIPAPTMSIIMH